MSQFGLQVLGSRHLAKLIGRPISGDHPENADEPGANDNPSVSGTNAQVLFRLLLSHHALCLK